jgi:four helix bundle protein
MTYDLKIRSKQFAKDVRRWIKRVPKRITSVDDCKQVIRSSGSIGANYIEADGSLGPGDFLHKLRICRKEAHETSYWLELILCEVIEEDRQEGERLIKESQEFLRIFSSIIRSKSHS